MSENNFQLKLKQSQQLNQSMQQSLRVLQMSSQEIEREVEDWLLDNPLLEKVESDGESDLPYEPPLVSAAVSQRNVSLEDSESAWENLADEEDLYAYLHKQVSEHPLTQLEAAHVHVLIDFLDEKGYLTESIEEIVDNTPLEWMLSEEDLEIALEHLRNFDPPGIATENLQQSLLHQLSRLPITLARRCASHIVMHHLDKLTPNQPKNVIRLGKLLPEFSDSVLKAALKMITGLNPYPAYGFSSGEPVSYVSPDIFVHNDGKGWQAFSNRESGPQIRINQELSDALADSEGIDSAWREKIIGAKQKIDMLAQRKNTVLRVAEYIVERQQDFFQFGEIALAPMLLKECAQHLNLAESTISRAVSNKYLACPQGLFALRYFFSHAVSGDTKEGLSANAIKSVISQLVDNEDKRKPYSDCMLHKFLHQQGIDIARRTVAKYREQLGIPPVQHRRHS